MFIKQVTNQLCKYKIPYAVVGGQAVALHGVVRGTVDLDFVIEWNLENLELTKKALEEIGLKPSLPISPQELFKKKDYYMEEKNMLAWNFVNPKNPLEVVDIVINYNFNKNMITEIVIDDMKVNVLSKKYLIEMKKQSTREQDLIDAKMLEDI